jgi:Ca2+:H+ antiporter
VSEIFVESVQEAAEEFGMSQAFVGFVVVALVGGAAEMAVAFSAARKDRLDLSVGIALGSASQIALFVAPVLVLLSYVVGPMPMEILARRCGDGFRCHACRGVHYKQRAFGLVLLILVYGVFVITLYMLPPQAERAGL